MLPEKFAEILFSDYLVKSKSENKADKKTLTNNTYAQSSVHAKSEALEPKPIITNHGNILKGLWGEEAIYKFFEKKFAYKYNGILEATPNGFMVMGYKIDKNNTRYKIEVSVYFPNKGTFYEYHLSKIRYKKGPYDMKIVKRIHGEFYPEKWPSNTKCKLIEVKATEKESKALASLSKNEWDTVKKYNQIYNIYRIYNTGEWHTSLNIIDDIKAKVESGQVLDSIKIKI